jgi:glycopeptide antibiotics resistance protein
MPGPLVEPVETEGVHVPTVRRALQAAFAVYLVAVLYLVLWPQPDTAGSGVEQVTALLRRAGFGAVTGAHVEVGLNVVLFVPLGLLGVLLWPRLAWWGWGPLGLALSAFLESFQWAFLPGRSATVSDLVANTAGALLGAAASAVLLWEVHRTRSGATDRPPLVDLRHVLVAAAGFLGVGAVLVLEPSAGIATSSVREISGWLQDRDAPSWLASRDLWERLLNVALFVPIGVLGALLRPGWSLVRWALVGAAGSLAIESAQWVLVPGRDASVSDLVTNTVGAVLGAALVRSVARRRAQ